MHCNGKCQLKKELKEDDKREKSNAKNINEKVDWQLFEQHISAVLIVSHVNSTVPLANCSGMRLAGHTHSVFHPPRIVFV